MAKEMLLNEKEFIDKEKDLLSLADISEINNWEIHEHIIYSNGSIVYHKKNKKILIDKRKNK